MKTKTSTKFVIILIYLSFSFSVFGQKPEFKFGKIDMADLTATKCPIDSSADAYVLGDYGATSFEWQNEKSNFRTIYEAHYRIKILKKTALDWANKIIPLYKWSNGSEEKVSDLKCNTYNLEDGKIVVSKLEKSSTFKEEASKNRINFRFSMPNVKEGSVIEISYKIYSESRNIRDWTFQMSIPVLVSKYEVRIPEYYNFKVFQNGYVSIKVENTTIPSSFTYSWEETDKMGMRIPNSRQSQQMDYQTNITSYYVENLKAFHDEPYMSSRINYMSSVEYELQSYQYPYSRLVNISSDWKSITKSLLDYDDFGDIIKKEGATSDIVKSATTGASKPIEKAVGIFNYIRNEFKWTRSERIYASQSIKKTIETKSGNCTDINLMLVAALRNAGLNADPVVLSTRDNGMILMSYPVMQKLNYVMASVEIEGKRYLLDATDKHAIFGFVPERCLNGQGRIISETMPGDVDLTSNHSYVQNISLNLKLNESGEFNGTWEETRKGYAAHNFRDNVDDSKSKEDFVSEKQKKNPGLTINSFEFKNLEDSLEKDVLIKYDVAVSGQTESTGNLLMVHPLLLEQLQENPFKMEDRKFPVDYSYTLTKTFIAQFEIPQGYQVETLPKALSMALPNKDATFIFNVVSMGNKIQIMRKMTINKILYLQESYANLKEFYNKMVSKEAEVIVLKKL